MVSGSLDPGGLVPQDIERSLVSDVEARRRASDGQGGIRTLETV
jgi:hypothetical protein